MMATTVAPVAVVQEVRRLIACVCKEQVFLQRPDLKADIVKEEMFDLYHGCQQKNVIVAQKSHVANCKAMHANKQRWPAKCVERRRLVQYKTHNNNRYEAINKYNNRKSNRDEAIN